MLTGTQGENEEMCTSQFDNAIPALYVDAEEFTSTKEQNSFVMWLYTHILESFWLEIDAYN